MINNIYDANFINEVLNEEKLVLVDFSAIWCGPCKMVAPILEEIAYENSNVKIVKMDVDVSPFVSRKYRINSIPNIKFFKNGRIVDEIIGFAPKKEIEAVINRNLQVYTTEENWYEPKIWYSYCRKWTSWTFGSFKC